MLTWIIVGASKATRTMHGKAIDYEKKNSAMSKEFKFISS